jgi:hypothetical protein
LAQSQIQLNSNSSRRLVGGGLGVVNAGLISNGVNEPINGFNLGVNSNMSNGSSQNPGI